MRKFIHKIEKVQLAYQTFIKHKRWETGESIITPVTMNQQQFLQKMESGYSKIGGHDCLHTLLTGYTNTNIGHVYHGNIISPITWKWKLTKIYWSR